MEQEAFNQVTEEQVQENVMFKVTPFSKYLALALFVALPFIGGWIGYQYAPEKIVEVERVVTEEASTDVNDWALPSNTPRNDTQNSLNNQVEDRQLFTISSSSLKAGWDTYRSERYNFEMSFPSYFNVSENEYDQVSTIISFSSPDLTILVLPNGGADYGLEGVDFISEEIEMGANTETKWIGKEGDFYREFVYVSSTSIPASWTNLNRIEVRGEQNNLTNEILSTLNFLTVNDSDLIEYLGLSKNNKYYAFINKDEPYLYLLNQETDETEVFATADDLSFLNFEYDRTLTRLYPNDSGTAIYFDQTIPKPCITGGGVVYKSGGEVLVEVFSNIVQFDWLSDSEYQYKELIQVQDATFKEFEMFPSDCGTEVADKYTANRLEF